MLIKKKPNENSNIAFSNVFHNFIEIKYNSCLQGNKKNDHKGKPLKCCYGNFNIYFIFIC